MSLKRLQMPPNVISLSVSHTHMHAHSARPSRPADDNVTEPNLDPVAQVQ